MKSLVTAYVVTSIKKLYILDQYRKDDMNLVYKSTKVDYLKSATAKIPPIEKYKKIHEG